MTAKRTRQKANRARGGGKATSPRRAAKAPKIPPRFWMNPAPSLSGKAAQEALTERAREVLEIAGCDLGAAEDPLLAGRLKETALFALGLIRWSAALLSGAVKDPEFKIGPEDFPPTPDRHIGLEASLAARLAADLFVMHSEIAKTGKS